ncbi:hypothetical protein GGI42DRAFT_234172 [Trichoderma sp. SZMC 28013]
MAGLRRHTRFYPFFHFYFFIFLYNHLAILDYEARPISSCIPLFILYTHNQALAFGELAERRSVQQKKKNSRKTFSVPPAYGGSCVVGLDHGSAVGKQEKGPQTLPFLILVWRTRALLRPYTTILQQQRGVAALAYELQYTGAKREARRTRKRVGLGWAGLDWRRAFWERERLSRTFKLGGSRAACIWTFFSFLKFFGQQEKG